MKRPMKRYQKVALTAALLFALLFAAVLWYANDYYRASPEAQEALASSSSVQVEKGDPLRFLPAEAGVNTGIIFYPGGKVAAEAYAPLMQDLAAAGYAVYVPEMPLKLAVLDQDAATDIIAAHPEVEHWYIGGHSLGGAMAASYAAQHAELLEGLLLLAAYSTEDLSGTGLAVLAVSGSEDGVIDQERLAENAALMPDRYQEVELEGGNHAQFGSYGEQEGDQPATLLPEEQQRQTFEAIHSFIETNRE